MCNICENKDFRFDNGSYTSLGGTREKIFVDEYFVFKPEENEESYPAVHVDIFYKGRDVYRSKTRIRYCPFCGQKLRESE